MEKEGEGGEREKEIPFHSVERRYFLYFIDS